MVAVWGNNNLVSCCISKFHQSLIDLWWIVRHDLYIKIITKAIREPLQMLLCYSIIIYLNSLID